MDNRPKGWAADQNAVRDRRALAASLEGQRLRSVRYVTVDYLRCQHAPEFEGVRVIESSDEWAEPSWLQHGLHSVDFGVELITQDDQSFYATWDLPGEYESLCLARGPLEDWVLNAALWDVSTTEHWRSLIGEEFQTVALDYEPWAPEGGFWCTGISLSLGKVEVSFIFGEVDSDGSITPSVDNLVVSMTAAQ